MSQKTRVTESQLKERLKDSEKTINLLKTENEMLRNIIAMIPGNVYWKDKDGNFLGCNNNVAQIFGFQSPREIIGKQNSDLFDIRLAALADKIDKEVNISAKEKYVEEKGLTFYNEPAIYLSKKLPLFDDNGNVIGLLGVSFDITERKKMEEDLKIAKEKAEASSRAKTQFLAVVNHELRTPLTSIVGLIDFLKQGNLPADEEKNIVEAIENCTQHLLSLVNEVLDFSRLETGEYNIRAEPVSLNAILYEVYGITKTLAKKKGIELRIQSGANVPKNILTDSRVLRQILINLVSNGIKFTDKGSVTIQLKSLQQKAHITQLEITVIDTGFGIPSDKLNLIFEPFQQLEDAYKRQSSRAGTGLGLTIVEKLAALIKAEIRVESEPGKGSAFSLIGTFETLKNDDTSGPHVLVFEKLRKKIRKKNTGSKKTIYPNIITQKPIVLLVEDDPIIQYVHTKMLTDLGCEVHAVSHGYEAINTLNNHDIVFVDISLPDISGFEVIKSIRERNNTRKVPIVALTVYTGKEEKLACLNAGADEFTSKPISQTHLKKLLLRYLRPCV